MKIVVAPDAFKGTLTQVEAAMVMKRAIHDVVPNANVVTKPMADGGEGTLDVLLTDAVQGKSHSITVTGPVGEKITTEIGIINENTAVIEVANVIGLPLVDKQHPNPYETTTFGLGEAIQLALEQGIRKFIIGLGGSATNDGGFGMLQALGARFKDQHGKDVGKYGRSLMDITSTNLLTLDPRLKDCTFEIITDVSNPLYGDHGATAVFGPQKGATKQQIKVLDEAMKNYADVILSPDNDFKEDLAHKKGAGAAGGLGFAFLLLGGKLVPGASYISKLIHLEEDIATADFVLTGEGKSDEQTVFSGKAPAYVADIAAKHNVSCILISGTIGNRLLLEEVFTEIHTLVDDTITEQEAMEEPKEVLYNKTKQIIKEKILHD